MFSVNVEKIEEYVDNNSILKPGCVEWKPLVSKGRVFVQGSFANKLTRQLFERYGYETVNNLEDSDIVVWTGGEDINPRLYNEKPAGAIGWNDIRDAQDIAAVDKSRDRFKVGICRGAQLLNCYPNGGKLWQDVDHHGGGEHQVTDHITGDTVWLNSIHHQALRLTDKAELVASTNLSTVKDSYEEIWHVDNSKKDPDVEVAWYPGTKSLCFQSHPEFEQKGSTGKYFMSLMERYWLAA